MREVLDLTPEMLPVLKEAGVVDSGGEGLLIIIEGALRLLKEKFPERGGGQRNQKKRPIKKRQSSQKR